MKEGDRRKHTTRRTDFLDDSWSSPDIMSSSRIWHGCLRTLEIACSGTYGIGFLEIKDTVISTVV